MPTMTFRKVRSAERSDDRAVQITLFKDEQSRVCGWFLGPLHITPSGVGIPYLARSERALASVAIVRAIAAGVAANAPLCIIDPDDLWEPAWQGHKA